MEILQKPYFIAEITAAIVRKTFSYAVWTDQYIEARERNT